MKKRGVVLDGVKLVRLYHRKGWSQQDLARKTGLDARTIAKVKRGGTCDASTLQLLCQALEVKPDDLLAVDFQQPSGDSVGAAPAHNSPFSANHNWSQSLRIIQVWKIIDLRNPFLHGATASGLVVERYRMCKPNADRPAITFPYLTWGEGIECISKPADATWTQVPVEVGDLVHSEKQWELTTATPEGPAGTQFDCGPIELRFKNAFHSDGQQWWQIRVAYEIQSLVIQVLFSKEQKCLKLDGTWAMPGQRKFSALTDNEPFLLPDGSVANWHIQQPPIGAFYKLAWSW